MTTLFQLHANIATLKAKTNKMSQLWHAGDKILLMGMTAAYYDWLQEYIADINSNDQTIHAIKDIGRVYILKEDLNTLNESAKLNINLATFKATKITPISDREWIDITQEVDRVVTIS